MEKKEWCHELCKKIFIEVWDDNEFPEICHEYCHDINCNYEHADYRDRG